MNKRNLRLDKYGISNKRYKELCGFCEQYPEWKAKLKDYAYLPGMELSDMPKSPNKGQSDLTSKAAMRMMMYRHNCTMIENVAKKADAEFWQYLIKSICYEVPLAYLLGVDEMPLEKSAFYERRRYFFYLLDQEKNAEK